MRPLAIVIASGAILTGIAAFFSEPFEHARSVRLTGVVSSNEVIVSAQIGGRIEELHCDEGSWVKKGELLVVLDREEVEAQREDQLARINQLSAKLSQDQDEVHLARDRSETLIEGAEAQLQLARSQRAEAVAEMAQLQKDVERMKGLVKEGLVPAQHAEQTETSLLVAEAKIQSLDDQIRTAQAQLDLARANEQQVQVARRDVEQTRAELQQARAQLSRVETRLGYTEVRAPLSGMVSLRVSRQGEVVNPGSPILTIVDLDDIWIKTDVEESLVPRTWVGQTLEVQLPSGEEVQGKVTFISPEAEFATQRDVDREKRDIRTFGIKVAVPNPDRRLHPGMTAYVLLPTDSAVPVTARAPDAVLESSRNEETPEEDRHENLEAQHVAAAAGEPGERTTENGATDEAAQKVVTPDVVPPKPAVRADIVPEAATPRAEPPEDIAPVGKGEELRSDYQPQVETEEPPVETRSVTPDRNPEIPESVPVDIPPETEEESEYIKTLIRAVAPELEGMLDELPPDFERVAPSIEDLEEMKKVLSGENEGSNADGDESAPVERLPTLVLRATSIVDGRPVAVINYQRVVEGDIVDGARVIRIADGIVELEYGDQLITLRLSTP